MILPCWKAGKYLKETPMPMSKHELILKEEQQTPGISSNSALSRVAMDVATPENEDEQTQPLTC
jgi:hypothetical protein